MILPLLLAAAAGNPAATIPRRAGQCGWVRGRFAVYNGSSVSRIWVTGTRHVLALRDDDQDVPAAVQNYWLGEPPVRELWGKFYVCARERWIDGHMQHVRILRTRRTRITAR